MNAITVLSLSKTYTNKTVDGTGALKGAPCTIKSTTYDADKNAKVVFEWTSNSGNKEESQITVKAGISIKELVVDEENNTFMFVYSDDTHTQLVDIPVQKIKLSEESGNAIVLKEDGLYVSTTGVEISKDAKNIIKNKADGLYADAEDKVSIEQGIANKGKALIVGEDGNVTVGDAGVKVSKDTNNAITEGTDKGIFVDKTKFVASEQGIANKGKSLIVGEDGNVALGKAEIDIATTFGTELSDAKVPSEKLVKNSLDAIDGKSLNVDNTAETKVTVAKAITDNKDAIDLLNADDETDGSVDNKIATAIGATQHLEKEVLDHKPTVEEAKDNILYLVPTDKEGIYNQYVKIGDKIVDLDNTEIDLTNYVEIEQGEDNKGKAMIVGDNGKLAPSEIPTTKIVDKTVAEYDALTDEQKHDTSIIYNLTDEEPIDLSEYAKKADTVAKAQGEENKGKALVVGEDGNVTLSEIESIGIDDDVIATDSTWSSEKINDSLVDLENEVGNVYSTEETVCGKWIDGKKIYRRVLLCATDIRLDSQGDWTTVPGWSETPSYIKEFVRIDTSNISLGHRIDYAIQANKTLKFYSLASYLFVKVGDKLIIEYTKTTD